MISNLDKAKILVKALPFIKKYHGDQIVKDSYFLFEERLKEDGYNKI